MKVPRRLPALALAVVALGLTVTGVVLAATDSSPGGASHDPLALNGYPPRTAQLHVVVSTGQLYDVTADVSVNFLTNAVAGEVHVPFAFSTADLDLRLVGGRAYLSSSSLPSVMSARWLALPLHVTTLYGLSLEMTRPDISLISGFPERSVTHDGYLTTYRYHRDNVGISVPTGVPFSVPARASVDFSITLGRQNELVAMSFAVASKHSHASVTVTVTSYNAPAKIVAPPQKDVTAVSSGELRQLFGSSSLGSLFNTKSVLPLGPISLS